VVVAEDLALEREDRIAERRLVVGQVAQAGPGVGQ